VYVVNKPSEERR